MVDIVTVRGYCDKVNKKHNVVGSLQSIHQQFLDLLKFKVSKNRRFQTTHGFINVTINKLPHSYYIKCGSFYTAGNNIKLLPVKQDTEAGY